jgi:hypothetical protein
MPDTQTLSEQLESFVDSHGLRIVLDALANTCWEKAEHIAQNWQDDGLAKVWKTAGNRISKLSDSAAVRAIP